MTVNRLKLSEIWNMMKPLSKMLARQALERQEVAGKGGGRV
jgi:hypothetical protein